MAGRKRQDIRPGIEVDIVLKKDQRTGKMTRGIVKDILTKSTDHPHGIKVRLIGGQVGRVKNVLNHPGSMSTTRQCSDPNRKRTGCLKNTGRFRRAKS
jgi:uncharacterized repeat protein (TIGR03833 family)